MTTPAYFYEVSTTNTAPTAPFQTEVYFHENTNLELSNVYGVDPYARGWAAFVVPSGGGSGTRLTGQLWPRGEGFSTEIIQTDADGGSP